MPTFRLKPTNIPRYTSPGLAGIDTNNNPIYDLTLTRRDPRAIITIDQLATQVHNLIESSRARGKIVAVTVGIGLQNRRGGKPTYPSIGTFSGKDYRSELQIEEAIRASVNGYAGDGLDVREVDGDEAEHDLIGARLFVSTVPTAAGGCSDTDPEWIRSTNNCLWNCLFMVRGGEPFPTAGRGMGEITITHADHLKKFLGLDYDDPVPIGMLPAIERYMGKSWRFSVTGDHSYEGPAAMRTVSLSLTNGHYSLRHESDPENKLRVCSRSPDACRNQKQRPLAVYDASTGEFVIALPDPTGGISIVRKAVTSEQYLEEKKQFCIVANRVGNESRTAEEMLEDVQAKCKDIDLVCDKFRIGNAYRLTGSISLVCESLLYLAFEGLQFPQAVEENSQEEVWIRAAAGGSYTYSTNYDGPAWSIDRNGAYAASMNEKIRIPKARGVWKILSNEEKREYYSLGLYRLDASQAALLRKKSALRMLMRGPSQLPIYTSHELTAMAKVGFYAKLAQDGHPNACLYVGAELSYDRAEMVFGRMIRTCQEQKHGLNGKRAGVKLLMASLWGTLMMRNIGRTIVAGCSANGEVAKLPTYDRIANIIIPVGKSGEQSTQPPLVQTLRTGGYYRHSGLARIGVFLRGHSMAQTTLKTNEAFRAGHTIVRVHTDGFAMSCADVNQALESPLAKNTNQSELGKWKIEKTGNCKVTGVNSCVFS